jgi:2-polyprenyl-6-methoxyphenol hydroxylase-like FAD-dependent oxidoreductase
MQKRDDDHCKRQREHVVVAGASVSGLLTARVLSEYFRHVTVVERDELPLEPLNRRGVPQARHVHALTARGSQIMAELFPGILDELVARGVEVWDDGDLSKFHSCFGGHQLLASDHLRNPHLMYFASRPLLEWTLRHRTEALPNVTILDKRQVASLTSTADGGRVTGVSVLGVDGGAAQTVKADLVVDATGRGSRAPVYLEGLGYGRPPELEVTVQLVYASQKLRLSPDRLTKYLVGVTPQPDRPTTWALARQEDDNWILTLGAMCGKKPPTDWDERLSWAVGLVPSEVLDALALAQPLGEVVLHRLPSNRWRRYDKMRRFPDGFLIVGDALCSFNPIYGQGMTVAALQAIVLRDCLGRGRNNLAQAFFRDASKKVRVAWQTAVGADLTLPQVLGTRSRAMRITNAYLERVMTAAEIDLRITEQFLRITSMLDSPLRMLHPGFMLRVAIANRRRNV